jgi:PIN domain nuclease of toxin-antitoxin system
VKLLLDTHAFIWWDSGDPRLSARALTACNAASNTLHLSLASVWELQIKAQLGKISLRIPLAQILQDQQQQNGLLLETMTLNDILSLSTLPPHHRDPFDRMLVAQTLSGGFHLVSNDAEIARYGVPLIW